MSGDELVALYDPDDPVGRVTGTAPRSRVRRENLPHAATCVVVRRSSGEVLLHRRSEAKDVYPGLRDCSFCGVVLAGEEPQAAAARELEEEAGIGVADLTALGSAWYRDEHTWYLGFVFRTTWDAAVRFEDGEVIEAWWEAPDAVVAALADPATPFVPDTRSLLTRLPREAVFGGF
ncbi:MAG: NUDIX hydrolase [Kineosporiaceae bacterium]